MLLCSDNDSALVLILFRDTDGRMLLDIFDENLHPLSVSSSASSSLSCELSFFSVCFVLFQSPIWKYFFLRNPKCHQTMTNMTRSRNRFTALSGRCSVLLN